MGGFVRHKLFNGAYTVVSSEAMDAAYGVSPDTVVLTVRGDVAETAERVRSVFADRNYYAIPALEAYEWDTASLENIFDLVAALAFVLSALVLAVLFAGTVIGRAHSERTRGSLLAAGLSKTHCWGRKSPSTPFRQSPRLRLRCPSARLRRCASSTRSGCSGCTSSSCSTRVWLSPRERCSPRSISQSRSSRGSEDITA